MDLLGINLAKARRCLEQRYDLKVAIQILMEMVVSVREVHKRGFIHRDVKASNFVMCKENRQVFIVDFGLAKMIGPNEKAEEPFGTLGYVAPEILEKKPYSFQCDMWSLGCIVYALLCSSLPFDHDS